MEELSKRSLWNTPVQELTVGDQYKLAFAGTAVVTVASLAVWGAVVGGAYVWERYQNHKLEKDFEKSEK